MGKIGRIGERTAWARLQADKIGSGLVLGTYRIGADGKAAPVPKGAIPASRNVERYPISEQPSPAEDLGNRYWSFNIS